MSGSILFIGTSFLGAIKQAYDSRLPRSGFATFVGFNAPELAANLKSGWNVVDGRLKLEFSCFVSGCADCLEKNSLHRTWGETAKVSSFDIDLQSYSKIVLVDMYHRLRPAFHVNDRRFLSIEGKPVSARLLAELQINGFNGWVSLRQHPLFGNVPFVNAKRLITAIKDAAGPASVMLLAAPRPPTGNIDISVRYGNVADARRSFDYLEQFYTDELARVGVDYLPQPLEVLDGDGCLTRAQYSRGAHPTKAGVADAHMNINYGEVILTKYADRLLGCN